MEPFEVREIREEIIKITQGKLSRFCLVEPRTIQRYESGESKIPEDIQKVLRLLAEYKTISQEVIRKRDKILRERKERKYWDSVFQNKKQLCRAAQ